MVFDSSSSQQGPVVLLQVQHKHQTKMPVLVLSSVGLPSLVKRDQGHWLVLVPEAQAAEAQDQWDAYLQENANWPPPEPPPISLEPAVWGTFGYALVVVVVFGWSNSKFYGVDWKSVGAAHADLIRHGHLWRCVTALTLHADTAHAASNLLFGALFGAGVAQKLGAARGWFMIVVAGALGNLVAAFVRGGPDYRAIGASTAVFAALGLMVAFRVRERSLREMPLYRSLAPLMAGAALFSWFGLGGPGVDITAHATGLLSGMAIGWWLSARTWSPGKMAHQVLWLFLLILLLGGSWGIAITL